MGRESQCKRKEGRCSLKNIEVDIDVYSLDYGKRNMMSMDNNYIFSLSNANQCQFP